MYVCVCTGVTDHEIRRRVQAGITTFERLQMELGVATCCGQCADCARDVVHESLNHLQATTEA